MDGEQKTAKGGGRKRVEELSKNEKGLMGMNNKVVIEVEEGV